MSTTPEDSTTKSALIEEAEAAATAVKEVDAALRKGSSRANDGGLPVRKLSIVEKTMLEDADEWQSILKWAQESGFASDSLSTLHSMREQHPSTEDLVETTRYAKLVKLGLQPEEALKLRNQVARRLREVEMMPGSTRDLFVKEGKCWVRKRTLWMERWERRYIRLNLRAEVLRIAKHQGACKSGKCPKVHLIDICRVSKGVDGEFILYIRDHSIAGKMRAMHLRVEHEAEALRWVEMIREKVYMHARTYQVGPDFTFPEIGVGYTPTTGICFTGGGSRSYAATLGQLRSLTKNNCMSKIQYSSSVSASAWATSIYTYYNQGANDDDELLGTGWLPWKLEEITMAYLSKPACPMVAPATKNIILEATNAFFAHNQHDMWIEMVANVYLKPFGLDSNATFTLPQLVDNILALNPQLEDELFHVAHPGRPFQIMNATIVGPSWARVGETLAPIQFTPMYSGSPFCHVLEYTPRHQTNNQTKQVWVGGGLLDTFAFGSREPEDRDSSGTVPQALKAAWSHIKRSLEKVESEIRELLASGNDAVTAKRRSMGGITGKLVQLERPRRLFTLKQACGITSDAPGLKLQHSYLGNRYNPQGLMWSPEAIATEGVDKAQKEAQLFDMVDGGSIDNTGLLALLQRKVKRCVLFVNSRLGIPEAPDDAAVENADEGSKHSTSSRWSVRRNILGFRGSQSEPSGVRHTTSTGENLAETSRSDSQLDGTQTSATSTENTTDISSSPPQASIEPETIPVVRKSSNNQPNVSRKPKGSGMGAKELQAAHEADVIMKDGTHGLKKLGSLGANASSLVRKVAARANGDDLEMTSEEAEDFDDCNINTVTSLESILTDATVDGENGRDYSDSAYATVNDSSKPGEDDDIEGFSDTVDYESLPNLDILALFGCKIDPAWKDFGDFTRNQVFETAELKPLLKKFQDLASKGEPLVVQDRYHVLDNEWWGIEGGWDVDIMWVYLNKADRFVDQLAPDVQEEIKKGDTGAFPNFPNFKTLNANKSAPGHRHHIVDSCLTVEQVNLLAGYTEWTIDQHLDQINHFLDIHNFLNKEDVLLTVHELEQEGFA